MGTVMAMYPANASFDRSYYLEKHMPLVRANLQPHGLTNTEVRFPSGTPAYNGP